MESIECTEEENEISSQEGLRIFGELRKKYCNNSVRDLDIVLNSLCCALVRLGKLNTGKGDENNFASLIHRIILDNMLKDTIP